MKWAALKPGGGCPVWEIMPWIHRSVQFGHRAGLTCVCQPCLDDTVLVHHEWVKGKPIRCDEEGGHICSLRGPDENRQSHPLREDEVR